MTIRATGRARMIIVTGFFLCASGALHATEGDTQSQASEPTATVGSATDTSAEPAKATRHHSAKKSASKSRKSDRVTSKAARKAADEEAPKAEASKQDNAKPDNGGGAMPASVANANAQWPSDAPAANTSNMTSQAGGVLNQMSGQQDQPATASAEAGSSNMQVVAADQLNDLDRAISDSKPPLTLAKATIDAPASEATAVSQDTTTWDKTSLVGKIFIAFGGLLTMASAARMFMA